LQLKWNFAGFCEDKAGEICGGAAAITLLLACAKP
jgi:hypothetical protein